MRVRKLSRAANYEKKTGRCQIEPKYAYRGNTRIGEAHSQPLNPQLSSIDLVTCAYITSTLSYEPCALNTPDLMAAGCY